MTGLGMTVNGFDEAALAPLTATEIGPVVAAFGTVTVSALAEAYDTVAATPLNRTVSLPGLESKPCP